VFRGFAKYDSTSVVPSRAGGEDTTLQAQGSFIDATPERVLRHSAALEAIGRPAAWVYLEFAGFIENGA
jgi:hypothetical protein